MRVLVAAVLACSLTAVAAERDPSADGPFAVGVTTRTFVDAVRSRTLVTVTIAGGTHSGLTDMDAHLSPEALAREETLARRYAVAFLERYLGRRRRAARFLTAADAGDAGPDVTLAARP